MKIALYVPAPDAVSSPWVSPLNTPRFRDLFREQGWSVLYPEEADKPTKLYPDLRLIEIPPDGQGSDSWRTLLQSENSRSIPTILVDWRDTARVGHNGREAIQHECVKAYVMPFRYRPLGLQNVHHADSSLAGRAIYEKWLAPHERSELFPSNPHHLEPLPCISEKNLAKLTALNMTPWSERMFQLDMAYEYLTKEKEARSHGYDTRPIDVLFLGTMYGYTFQWTRWHRYKAVHMVRSLPPELVVCASGTIGTDFGQVRPTLDARYMHAEHHFDLMLRSKIVVSPYGYGEVTFRDYEAAMAGCHIIKPYCDYVITSPSPFRFKDKSGFGNFTSCNPDFSDAPQLIENLLRTPRSSGATFTDIAIEHAFSLCELRRDPSSLVESWVNLFTKALA